MHLTWQINIVEFRRWCLSKGDDPGHTRSQISNNSTKKWQHTFDILKAFFIRHPSEYKTSDSDRKVN